MTLSDRPRSLAVALTAARAGAPPRPDHDPPLPSRLGQDPDAGGGASANPGRSNSTTLTWTIDDVAARGARYLLRVDVAPYDGGHSGGVKVSGQKGLLVVYASV